VKMKSRLSCAFALVVAGVACSGASGGGPDAAADGSPSDVAAETGDVAADGSDGSEAGDVAPDRPSDDAEPPSDAAPEVPASCPAEIANCAQAFVALKSQCPGAGVACVESTIGLDMLNRCYANGVRVYFDPGAETVLRADGRVCYSVQTVDTGQYLDSTIKDPLGNEVLRITHTLTATTNIFTCGSDYVEIPEDQQPCGDLDSLPPDLQCEPGTCDRP
jgi:hypothetical protein